MKLIERMEKDERLRVAAIVGETFHMDPMIVMRSDHFDYSARVAAHSVVMEERQKAQDKIKRSR